MLCFRPYHNALTFLRNYRLEQIDLNSRKRETLFPSEAMPNLHIYAYTWNPIGDVLYISANTSKSIQGDSHILRINDLKTNIDTLIFKTFIINTAAINISASASFHLPFNRLLIILWFVEEIGLRCHRRKCLLA